MHTASGKRARRPCHVSHRRSLAHIKGGHGAPAGAFDEAVGTGLRRPFRHFRKTRSRGRLPAGHIPGADGVGFFTAGTGGVLALQRLAGNRAGCPVPTRAYRTARTSLGSDHRHSGDWRELMPKRALGITLLGRWRRS